MKLAETKDRSDKRMNTSSTVAPAHTPSSSRSRYGSVWPDGHEHHRVIAPQPKVHAGLQAGSLAPAHLDVRHDIVRHGGPECH
jgi:hypothetical protein